MLTSCLMETFSNWLAIQLKDRGMTPADLARNANKAPAVISRILNNERDPAPDTLIAISHALKLPPETVFRAAGLLPPKPEHNERITEATYILSMLEEEDIDEIIQIARMKLERKKASPTRTSRKVKPPAQTVLNGQYNACSSFVNCNMNNN